MKKILFIGLFLIAVKAPAQIISMEGIGALKLDMKVAELEKLLGQKIPLKYVLMEDIYYDDTIKVKYKNVNYTLYISKQSTVDPDKFDYILHGLKTSSPLCKTSGGIGIGADKIRIVNGFEDHQVRIDPDYIDDTYTARSKTMLSIYVYDNFTDRAIIFRMKNKKVVEIELNVFSDDAE